MVPANLHKSFGIHKTPLLCDIRLAETNQHIQRMKFSLDTLKQNKLNFILWVRSASSVSFQVSHYGWLYVFTNETLSSGTPNPSSCVA